MNNLLKKRNPIDITNIKTAIHSFSFFSYPPSGRITSPCLTAGLIFLSDWSRCQIFYFNYKQIVYSISES